MDNNMINEITNHEEESVKKQPEQLSDEIFESHYANLKKLDEDMKEIKTTLRNMLEVLEHDKKYQKD